MGATSLPRQVNGVYAFCVEDEAVRVAVNGGQVDAAPDTEPTTTIELSRAGLGRLIIGTPASEIEQNGDLRIRGDRRRGRALLNVLTGPPLLEGLRRQLAAGRA